MRLLKLSVFRNFILTAMLFVLAVGSVSLVNYQATSQSSFSVATPESVKQGTSIDTIHLPFCEESFSNNKVGSCDYRSTISVKNGGHTVSFLNSSIVAAQLLIIFILLFQLYSKSDSTRRFSVVLFQHRSDGKKSALSLPEFL